MPSFADANYSAPLAFGRGADFLFGPHGPSGQVGRYGISSVVFIVLRAGCCVLQDFERAHGVSNVCLG